jgi:hypothetical protein
MESDKDFLHKTDDQPGWRFWLLWTFFNALSWGLGWVVSFWIGWGFASLALPLMGKTASDSLGWWTVGGLLGLWVGAPQWLLLRKRLPDARMWLLATVVGGVLGAELGWLAAPQVLQYGVGVETLGAWMVTGLVVGVAQWLVLRRSVSLATWWAAISALCWVLAMAGWPLGVIPASAISGAVMVWMLRHLTQEGN